MYIDNVTFFKFLYVKNYNYLLRHEICLNYFIEKIDMLYNNIKQHINVKKKKKKKKMKELY
jgi:hypothetical protein